MDKNQKEELRRQEDIALGRSLMWVGGAIVLEMLMLLVNKYYINFYTTEESINLAMTIGTVLSVVRWVALAAAVGSAAWVYMQVKKKGGLKLPMAALLGSLAVLFCAAVSLEYVDAGVRMLMLLIPGWAALALVYYLYQREFFISAVFSMLGVVALWLIRHKTSGLAMTYAFVALAVVVLIGGLVLVSKARKNGTVKISGHKVELFDKDTNYALLMGSAAVALAAMALALVLGGTVAYYLIYALIAWMFGLLVYYTVKMM